MASIDWPTRDALVAHYRSWDDPLDRAHAAAQWATTADGLVSFLADLRARALAELHVEGWSYGRIAEATGLSRARVQQLVERGRAVTI